MDYRIDGVMPDSEDRDSCLDQFHITGSGWYTLAQMLQFIDAGHTFHVTNGWSKVKVITKHRPGSAFAWARYLTTEADGIISNNLSHLART